MPFKPVITDPLSPVTRPVFGLGAVDPYVVDRLDPKLVSDFAAEYYRTSGAPTTFASMFTFARASTATYVDSAGVLQTAASGDPRIGHHVWDGSQWVNKGLLLESEARTNLLLSSGDFSGGNWGIIGAGNPTRSVVDGEQRISWTSGAGNILDSSSGPSPSAGETYTISFRVKVIDLDGSDPSTDFVLSLEDGDRTEGAVNSAVTLVDNGEYKVVSITHAFSAPSGTGMYCHFRYGGSNSPVLAIEYAQLEQGTTPSSYIPTSGSQVTRAADALTIPAANLPYSSTAMSIALEGTMTYADEDTNNQYALFQWRKDANNWIQGFWETDAGSGNIEWQQKANGGTNHVLDSSGSAYSPGINVPFSIASRHGATFINGAVDGTALTEDTTPTALPDLSATDLNLGYDFMGTISQFRMWDTDLGDSGIVEASS